MKRIPPAAPTDLPASGPLPVGMAPVPHLLTEAERGPALLLHVSPLLGLLLPGVGNLLGPLAAWLLFRDRSAALDEQGKEALNFQISMWVYSAVLTTLLLALGLLGLFGGLLGAAANSGAAAGFGLTSGLTLLLLLIPVGLFFYVIPTVFMIVAALSVSDGRAYRYPLTLRLLK